ncbi:MAG: glycosyltransferase family 2 protein [candidate division WOR-3 bacterium]|jgi:glycosyltransferase involved in cell wall biosynthesis
MEKVMVLIPVCNEERFIGKLIDEIKQKYGFKVIVVDDGSNDKTFEEAQKVADHVIRHTQNQGKGQSIIDGINFALGKSEYIILMDGDYQHSPDDIKNFLKQDYEKYDMLIGKRKMNFQNMPFDRYLTNRTTTLVTSLLATKRVFDSQSGFRMVKVESMKKLNLKYKRFQIESEMLIKAGRMKMDIGYVDIKTIYGDEKSKINKILDTLRFIRMCLEMLCL